MTIVRKKSRKVLNHGTHSQKQKTKRLKNNYNLDGGAVGDIDFVEFNRTINIEGFLQKKDKNWVELKITNPGKLPTFEKYLQLFELPNVANILNKIESIVWALRLDIKIINLLKNTVVIQSTAPGVTEPNGTIWYNTNDNKNYVLVSGSTNEWIAVEEIKVDTKDTTQLPSVSQSWYTLDVDEANNIKSATLQTGNQGDHAYFEGIKRYPEKESIKITKLGLILPLKIILKGGNTISFSEFTKALKNKNVDKLFEKKDNKITKFGEFPPNANANANANTNTSATGLAAESTADKSATGLAPGTADNQHSLSISLGPGNANGNANDAKKKKKSGTAGTNGHKDCYPVYIRYADFTAILEYANINRTSGMKELIITNLGELIKLLLPDIIKIGNTKYVIPIGLKTLYKQTQDSDKKYLYRCDKNFNNNSASDSELKYNGETVTITVDSDTNNYLIKIGGQEYNKQFDICKPEEETNQKKEIYIHCIEEFNKLDILGKDGKKLFPEFLKNVPYIFDLGSENSNVRDLSSETTETAAATAPTAAAANTTAATAAATADASKNAADAAVAATADASKNAADAAVAATADAGKKISQYLGGSVYYSLFIDKLNVVVMNNNMYNKNMLQENKRLPHTIIYFYENLETNTQKKSYSDVIDYLINSGCSDNIIKKMIQIGAKPPISEYNPTNTERDKGNIDILTKEIGDLKTQLAAAKAAAATNPSAPIQTNEVCTQKLQNFKDSYFNLLINLSHTPVLCIKIDDPEVVMEHFLTHCLPDNEKRWIEGMLISLKYKSFFDAPEGKTVRTIVNTIKTNLKKKIICNFYTWENTSLTWTAKSIEKPPPTEPDLDPDLDLDLDPEPGPPLYMIVAIDETSELIYCTKLNNKKPPPPTPTATPAPADDPGGGSGNAEGFGAQPDAGGADFGAGIAANFGDAGAGADFDADFGDDNNAGGFGGDFDAGFGAGGDAGGDNNAGLGDATTAAASGSGSGSAAADVTGAAGLGLGAGGFGSASGYLDVVPAHDNNAGASFGVGSPQLPPRSVVREGSFVREESFQLRPKSKPKSNLTRTNSNTSAVLGSGSGGSGGGYRPINRNTQGTKKLKRNYKKK